MCNMNKILEKAKELVAMLEEKEISDKVELWNQILRSIYG